MSRKWDIDSVRKEFQKRDYILISNNYVNNSTKLQYICPKHKDEGVLEIRFGDLRSGRGCRYCSFEKRSQKQRLTYSEVKQFIELDSNSGCKLLSNDYTRNSDKLKIQCKCGKVFTTTFDKFKSQNKRQCNECGFKIKNNYKRKTHEEYIGEINKKYNKEYSIIGKYQGNRKPILTRHNICGFEWMISPSNLLKGHGCPECVNSKGETIISEYLKENNINYISEYTFDDCRNKRPLPFDFYLPDYNLLIEYDGEQHFEPVDFFGGEEQFEYQKYNDNIKNTYCIKNNINLIRIPYWDFDNIEKILDEVLSNKGSAYFIA